MSRLLRRWALAAAIVAAGPCIAPALPSAINRVAVHVFAAPPTLHAQQEEPTSPRRQAPVTILQINDVYSTVPVDGLGGLARVATLKKQLADAGRTPLVLLAGDFLSSSVASSIFKGEQMIAGFNAMGLDVATLGNHEFDFGVDMLVTRMHQARWQWVVANVIDRQTNAIVGGAPPYVIRQVGPLKVGILGLCVTNEGMSNPELQERLTLLDPVDTAARYVPQMKREGADVVVALTHLRIATDRAIAERVPDIDVIVGGHEHYPITVVSGRTLISKAGMDARNVARIDIDRRGTAPLDRYFQLIPITSAIADDPDTAQVVNSWESRLSTELNDPVGSTAVPLDAVDARLRGSETNIADLVADAVRQQAHADVALVNSGGIRGNRIYPAGVLTRRDLIAIHPFGNVVCKIEVSGALLLRTLNIGVSRLPAAAGQFPAVSGVRFRVAEAAPPGDRVRDVRVGGAPLDRTKTYTLALPDYVLNGGDSYEGLKGAPVLIGPEDGMLIVTALEKYIGRREVSPRVDGRITIER